MAEKQNQRTCALDAIENVDWETAARHFKEKHRNAWGEALDKYSSSEKAAQHVLQRNRGCEEQTGRPSVHSTHDTTKAPGSASSGTGTPSRTESPDGRGPEESAKIQLEPETRPISQEQLVAEVKGIYAGLVMVEAKCIEVDNAQNAQRDSPPNLNNEQWQALIALHRTLLHEHHDFFLASQHPSASVALKRLASKYSMPARMWRHGIHSFLELLRHRLPGSLEHMLTFVYLAYSMMALLYETVPAFSETWVECLGDLGRYRMAIEDDNPLDREIWMGVSRSWYTRASENAPTTGRLYHHIAILCRPNVLQQMFYYTKSLCVDIPFLSARDSIMTLFEPMLSGKFSADKMSSVDAQYVLIHGILFSNRCTEKLLPTQNEYFGELDASIARLGKLWQSSGVHIGISNGNSLLMYGDEKSELFRDMRSSRHADEDHHMGDEEKTSGQVAVFDQTLEFVVTSHKLVLRRLGDPSVLGYFHTVLVFTFDLAKRGLLHHVQKKWPWKQIKDYLNTLSPKDPERWKSQDIFADRGSARPMPDDYALRGLKWAELYHTEAFFRNRNVDDEERSIELASFSEERKNRLGWLGVQISKAIVEKNKPKDAAQDWEPALQFSAESNQFSVPAEYEADGDDRLPAVARGESGDSPSSARLSTFAPAMTANSPPSRSSSWESSLIDRDEVMTDVQTPTLHS